MIKLFLKRQILKNRALILQEGKQIEEFFQLLMKQRNTGVKWTGDEKARLKSHLKRLSLYVPTLIIFVLPFGSFFIPILAEILDRREKSRANSKNAQMENSTMVSKGSPGRPEKSRYRRLTLLFMSGTGNSYRNAKWIESEAATLGLEVNLALVPATQPPLISLEQETLLGLVMPTHGFTAPWPMIKCVLKLPRGKRTHAFAIVGRGGSKIGNTYIPGVEGTACYLMALLLILKGFHVRGVLAVDMPANWVVAYPAPAPTKASEIMGRARTRTLAFFTSILEGKSVFGGGIGLSFGILLTPISIAYLLVGRFFLAKLFFANNDCNGCGLCAG